MKWRPIWMSRTTEMLMPYQSQPREWLLYCLAGYVFCAQFVKNKVVLDVACGTSYLVSKGARTVVGGDISREVMAYATAHYGKDRLHFIRLDAEELPFPDDSFDSIISCETIEHLTRYRSFLSECRRTLKAGGVFVCRTPNRQSAPFMFGRVRTRHHAKEFNADELHHLLADYFGKVTMYGQAHLLNHPTFSRRVFSILPLPMLAKLAWRILPFQVTTTVVYFMANLVYGGRLRFMKLEDIDEGGADFERIVDKHGEPYLLEDGSPVPGAIIAVASK